MAKDTYLLTPWSRILLENFEFYVFHPEVIKSRRD